MESLYERIVRLYLERGIKNDTELCRISGASRAILTDLKMGRSKSLSTENAVKIAGVLDVSLDYLLGNTEQKKPTPEGERSVDDDDIKVALFGGDGEVTDEMWEEAKFAIELIKERNRKRREQEKE